MLQPPAPASCSPGRSWTPGAAPGNLSPSALTRRSLYWSSGSIRADWVLLFIYLYTSAKLDGSQIVGTERNLSQNSLLLTRRSSTHPQQLIRGGPGLTCDRRLHCPHTKSQNRRNFPGHPFRNYWLHSPPPPDQKVSHNLFPVPWLFMSADERIACVCHYSTAGSQTNIWWQPMQNYHDLR